MSADPDAQRYVILMLLLAITPCHSLVKNFEIPISETLMGHVIYSDGSTDYEIIKPSTYSCSLGPDIVYVDTGNGCHNEESFQFNYGDVNMIRLNGEVKYFGKEVTVIEKGVIETYPAAHRAGLLFALKYGNNNVPPLTHVGNPPILLPTNTSFKLYKFPANTTASTETGWLCHSGSGDCRKNVHSVFEEYYYLTAGVGEEWIELGKDLPDKPDQYAPAPGVTREKYVVGVTPETSLTLRLPHQSESRRKKRSIAIGIASTALALTDIHRDSVRAGFAAADVTMGELATGLNGLIDIQTESLRREQAIYKLDLKILSATAVNNYIHRGFVSVAATIRSSLKAAEQYALSLTELQESFVESSQRLKETYRSKVVGEGMTLIDDRISGGFYVASVMVGTLTSGNLETGCDQMNCLVNGTFYHLKTATRSLKVEGVVLTTMTCGIYVKDLSEHARGVIDGSKTFIEKLNYLRTYLPESEYFYVTETLCSDTFPNLATPMVNKVFEKTWEVLNGNIQMVQDSFKIECPEDENFTTDEASVSIKSYLCNTDHSIQKLSTVISALEMLKVTVTSSLNAFNAEQKNRFLQLLNRIGDGGMDALGILAENAGKLIDLVKNGGVDRLDMRGKISLAIGTIALGLSLANTVLFLCLYSKLKRQIASALSKPSEDV